jgi:hypothetical protein
VRANERERCAMLYDDGRKSVAAEVSSSNNSSNSCTTAHEEDEVELAGKIKGRERRERERAKAGRLDAAYAQAHKKNTRARVRAALNLSTKICVFHVDVVRGLNRCDKFRENAYVFVCMCMRSSSKFIQLRYSRTKWTRSLEGDLELDSYVSLKEEYRSDARAREQSPSHYTKPPKLNETGLI